jgi:hypothetical protein
MPPRTPNRPIVAIPPVFSAAEKRKHIKTPARMEANENDKK